MHSYLTVTHSRKRMKRVGLKYACTSKAGSTGFITVLSVSDLIFITSVCSVRRYLTQNTKHEYATHTI